jgi:hypothetical protein
MLWTGSSRWRHSPKRQSTPTQNRMLLAESTGATSNFCPPSHSLEAVVGVTLAGPPPLYTESFARNANMKTRAQSVSSSARHSLRFRMIGQLSIGNNLTPMYLCT